MNSVRQRNIPQTSISEQNLPIVTASRLNIYKFGCMQILCLLQNLNQYKFGHNFCETNLMRLSILEISIAI